MTPEFSSDFELPSGFMRWLGANMKLIKAGAKENWWVGKHITCEQCRAVFELEKGDPVKEYKNDCGTQIYVECPECAKENRLYFR